MNKATVVLFSFLTMMLLTIAITRLKASTPDDYQQIRARVKCVTAIEKRLRYDYKWVWLEEKLVFQYHNSETGIDVYYGDRLKVKNSYGAYLPYSYHCYWNRENDHVSSITLNRIYQ